MILRTLTALSSLILLCGCSGCSAGGSPPQPTGGTSVGTASATGPGVTHGSGGKGFAIAIGLRTIDPAVYGSDGYLAGCEPDANDMAAIAQGLGHSVTRLLTQQATRNAVLASLADHASRLERGDLLIVSYSGHGGQVPDGNGDESDGLDETWCLYDGQLLDDELYDAWTRFRPGVRILVLSDSCHSGTVMRLRRPDVEGPSAADVKVLEARWKEACRMPKLDRRSLLTMDGFRAAIDRDKTLMDRVAKSPRLRALDGGRFELKETGVGLDEVDEVFVPRALPIGVVAEAYSKRKAFYDDIGAKVTPEGRNAVSASVLLISGCRDDQLSADITFNGLFTWALKQVWAGGAFTGNHVAFHAAIAQRVLQRNPDQSPSIDDSLCADTTFKASPALRP